MSGLADTISHLRALRAPNVQQTVSSRLQPLGDFGTNPGNLGAKAFVPTALPARSPLVVVLHGCTQTPEGYDAGSGWSELAQLDQFALLYPEQRRANNPTLCFNWFDPNDTKRGTGEVASISQMIDAMILTYDLNPERVFITGLSAGGAMTSSMLAAYPERFAGGAIIAGLPAGSARNVSEALQQMRAPGRSPAPAIARAKGQQRALPTISVWHGSADHTVSPSNADAIVEQWLTAHAVRSAPFEHVVDGYRQRRWRDADGRDVVEQFTIEGMGHGVPLALAGSDALGARGPYMLDVGMSSSHHIARFWGLERERTAAAPPGKSAPIDTPHTPMPRAPTGPQAIIEDALRRAGLMR